MKKYVILTALVSLMIAIQSCTNHPANGFSTTSIVTYSSTQIQEAAANDGTFNSTITITLSGDEFNATLVDGTDFETSNLPDGLTATLVRNSATQATLTITGTATNANSCSNGSVDFFFNDSAFKSGQLPISFEIPIVVAYVNPGLTFSVAELDEKSSNNGTFPTPIVVKATAGGQFYHNNTVVTAGTVLTNGTDYQWDDLPAGLVPAVVADSATQVTVTLSGAATNDTPAYDVPTTALKFLSHGLSSDFCAGQRGTIAFKFYRSVMMYAVTTNGGSLGTSGGRTGADFLCNVAKPTLPSDYTGYRAFITVSSSDDISHLDNNYGIPTTVNIESVAGGTGSRISNNWAGLLNTSTTPLVHSLAVAGVLGTATGYWTGTDIDGTIATGTGTGNTCSAWTSSLSTVTGTIGNSDSTDGTWLNNSTDTCDVTYALLCVAYAP